MQTFQRLERTVGWFSGSLLSEHLLSVKVLLLFARSSCFILSRPIVFKDFSCFCQIQTTWWNKFEGQRERERDLVWDSPVKEDGLDQRDHVSAGVVTSTNARYMDQLQRHKTRGVSGSMLYQFTCLHLHWLHHCFTASFHLQLMSVTFLLL